MEYLVFFFTFSGSWHTIYLVFLNHSTIFTDFNVIIGDPFTQKSKLSPNSSNILYQKYKFQFPSLDDSASLPIAQSQKCTPQELKLLIQCFKEIPLTDYYVLVNDSISISCVVNNQHGKVQWRAKNLVLGYDRSVPGMPRLQIVGDVTKGEHNLHISGAQVNDSGDYECQVQPVNAHPLLRRKSTLHVTSLPSQPVIKYKKEIPKNNEIIIDFNSNVKKMLKLICKSDGGSPIPIFQWFWNSREVVTDEMEFIQVTNNVPNTSTLVMPISFLKSGHEISCVVKNKATELLDSRSLLFKKKFEVKVVIIMLVRSGDPVIQNTVGTISENDDLELICSLKPTGHPKAKLKWKIRSTGDYHIENTINIKYNDKKDELVTELHLKRLNRMAHRLNVTCMSKNPFVTKLSAPFPILVKHLPDYLSIVTYNGESEGLVYQTSLASILQQSHETIINGIENEDINILCFTGSYFGNLNMKWVLQHSDYLDGSRLNMQILSPLIKLNYNLTVNETIQTYITQKIKLKRTFNSGFIECQGTLENQKILSRKSSFNIFYEPKISVISGYVSQFPVHEGDLIHLTCCAYGGNPTPTLRWYKNNSLVLISREVKNEKDELSLEFLYRVFKQDNGQKIHCEAKGEHIGVKTVKSSFLIINVIFPPSSLEISCSNCNPNKIIANNTNEFLCESGSSNPGSVIIWKLYNCSSVDTWNLTNCPSELIQGTLSTNFPGQFNGWKTQSRLNLRLNYRQDNFILQCQSRLTHKILPEKYKPIYKNLKLRVVYPPVIIDTLDSPYIFEGSTLNLEFQIVANPKPSSYAWYFKKEIISKNKHLMIENIQFNNSGKYTFFVENSQGSARASVHIDIKYSPRIFKTDVKIFNNTAILFCEAKMNPAYNNFSSVWKRVEAKDRISLTEYSEMEPFMSVNYSCGRISLPKEHSRIRATCGFSGKQTTYTKLILSPYQDSDFGWYQCSFDNGVGYKGFRNVHLNLPTKPWYLKISHFLKEGGDISHRSLLTCCFLSHVNPSIFWHVPFSNKILPSTNITEICPSTFCGSLQILVKNEKYFGQYKCQAKNSKGISRFAYVSLHSTSKPDFPENFQLHLLSAGSIKVSWIKGADGGSPQTFQLRWWDKKQQSILHYQTVTGNKTQERISTTISNFSAGSYTIEIGVNNMRFPDFRYCCAISFLILSTKNESFDHINTKPQNHIDYPDITFEKLSWSTYYIIIASSIVVFLSLFFALFIFLCVVKHRRKLSSCLQNRNKSVVVDSLLKLSDTLNESKIATDTLDITDDIPMKVTPSDPKTLFIDQETIKFLTPSSQLNLINYIPLSCPNMELSKSFISEFSPNQSISQTVTTNSHSPLLCQGVYGRFVMEKWQPCDCHLSMERDGIILMTNQ